MAGTWSNDPTEIASRKRIEPRHLEANVETDPQLHCSGCHQILLKSREEIVERPLAATEQGMHVPRLWGSTSVTSVLREDVALQHGDMLKVIGEDTGSGQARHPCSDHDRLPAYESRCHRRLPFEFYIPRAHMLSAECQTIFVPEATWFEPEETVATAVTGLMAPLLNSLPQQYAYIGSVHPH
jgi:hypothetical protein